MKMIKKFFMIVLIIPMIVMGGVLHWQVDIYNTATIKDGNEEYTGVYTFLSKRYDNELGAVVVACDGQGNVIAPLMLVEEPEFSDVPINASNPWMNQTIQSWMPEEMTQEMLFLMQVGIYDDDWNFTPILYSEFANMDEISKHTYEIQQISPIGNDWAPGAYHTTIPSPPTPEPSSFLLSLIGCSILLMRRKQESR